jgi:DNA-nicking Smr family endonuclease
MSEPPRRRRPLSAEERVLWEAVAKTAKPLRKKPRRTMIAPADKPVAAVSVELAPPQKKAAPVASPKVKRVTPPPPPVVVPLGRREKRSIAKGKREIGGKLDLHGMTQSEAHDRLLGFLRVMQARDESLVLVITGKGRLGAASERGVLRRQVPHWLALTEFRVYVSGFEEAHLAHGGEGALYVRLRRVRAIKE